MLNGIAVVSQAQVAERVACFLAVYERHRLRFSKTPTAASTFSSLPQQWQPFEAGNKRTVRVETQLNAEYGRFGRKPSPRGRHEITICKFVRGGELKARPFR